MLPADGRDAVPETGLHPVLHSSVAFRRQSPGASFTSPERDEQDDIWREDARTDRAIELLKICMAKTDETGAVVPSRRWSRSNQVAVFLMETAHDFFGPADVTMSGASPEDPVYRVTIDGRWMRGAGEVIWHQEGEATLSDGYNPMALAACRALLQYDGEDGELLTPDETVAMLEAQRQDALDAAAERQARRDPGKQTARNTTGKTAAPKKQAQIG